jgi:Transglycosylase SLT domain
MTALPMKPAVRGWVCAGSLAVCAAAGGVAPAMAQRHIYLSETAGGLPVFSSDPPVEGGRHYLALGDPPPPPARPPIVYEEVATMKLSPQRPEVRDWKVTTPSGYHALGVATAKAYGVPVALVLAVMHAESSFRPSAVSSAGAVGLMQIMPATGRRYGVARGLFEPAKNVDVGVRYLKDLLALFKGDTTLAVAAYNAGEGAVIKHGWRIPPYAETLEYVPRVIALYGRYRREYHPG